MADWQPVSQAVSARATAIPGLFEFQLDVRGDNRGWFKENYQREKIIAALDAIHAERRELIDARTSLSHTLMARVRAVNSMVRAMQNPTTFRLRASLIRTHSQKQHESGSRQERRHPSFCFLMTLSQQESRWPKI